MTKKITFNIAVIVVTYFLPIFVLNKQIEVSIGAATTGSIFMFGGAFLLIFFDNQYRKQDATHKWTWIFFETIGVLGLLYSIFSLFILMSFRHGIGF
ncbi:MAG: hypothetical protein V4486_00125 [Patescibacteria group bacterium]